MSYTYSILFEGAKRTWLKKQIGLARICAHEVPLEEATVVFTSPQDIRKLPKQGSLMAIVTTQHEMTLIEQDEVEAAVKEGRVRIAVSYLNRNIKTKLTRWFPPVTSCRDVPKSIVV